MVMKRLTYQDIKLQPRIQFHWLLGKRNCLIRYRNTTTKDCSDVISQHVAHVVMTSIYPFIVSLVVD